MGSTRDSVHVSSFRDARAPSVQTSVPAMISSDAVELQLAGLGVEQQVEEIEQVARVERAGVGGHACRQVRRRRRSCTPCLTTTWSALAERAVAALLRPPGRRSPSRASSPATVSSVTSTGAGRPGISAVVMTMSAALARSAISAGLAALVVVAHLARVAAGGFLRLASPRPRAAPRRTWRRAIRPAPSPPAARRTLRSTAPRRLAVAIACRPATPAPRTSTRAALTVPAAVISIGMKRPYSLAATSPPCSRRCWPATTARPSPARARCAAAAPCANAVTPVGASASRPPLVRGQQADQRCCRGAAAAAPTVPGRAP